ncbi:glutaredoxin [Lunasporangiospora selenospora]|uniref:Glutaredoxin n=1 Tax=Lunasporangiospora selenospora TaxID=979761 RepID=A0A9P6G136_9FUNG|nr:glutaredoxin [Lunasporangiospora selenospora]
MSAVIKNLTEKLIRENKIMFFGKSYCPFCRNAKQVLSEKGLHFKVYEIDLEKDGPEVQNYLLEKTGQRTVPNIFINTQHLGGNSDLVAAKENGKLDQMLGNEKHEL